MITGGFGSVIDGGLITSSVSNNNCDATIFLALRLLISTVNASPIANITSSKITTNCIGNGCSCNVCDTHFPSMRFVPNGH